MDYWDRTIKQINLEDSAEANWISLWLGSSSTHSKPAYEV